MYSLLLDICMFMVNHSNIEKQECMTSVCYCQVQMSNHAWRDGPHPGQTREVWGTDGLRYGSLALQHVLWNCKTPSVCSLYWTIDLYTSVLQYRVCCTVIIFKKKDTIIYRNWFFCKKRDNGILELGVLKKSDLYMPSVYL